MCQRERAPRDPYRFEQAPAWEFMKQNEQSGCIESHRRQQSEPLTTAFPVRRGEVQCHPRFTGPQLVGAWRWAGGGHHTWGGQERHTRPCESQRVWRPRRRTPFYIIRLSSVTTLRVLGRVIHAHWNPYALCRPQVVRSEDGKVIPPSLPSPSVFAHLSWSHFCCQLISICLLIFFYFAMWNRCVFFKIFPFERKPLVFFPFISLCGNFPGKLLLH